MRKGWHIKQRPAGDWAVQRWDAARGVLVRWGLFPDEQSARDTLAALKSTEVVG